MSVDGTIRIPKLGMSMHTAEISAWHVEDGATIAVGDLLYTLVTDKVEHDVESPAAGVIRIYGDVDTSYPVGEVIAEIVESANPG